MVGHLYEENKTGVVFRTLHTSKPGFKDPHGFSQSHSQLVATSGLEKPCTFVTLKCII